MNESFKATVRLRYITEFNWGVKESDVIVKLKHSMGYQAFPFDVQKAFNPQ